MPAIRTAISTTSSRTINSTRRSKTPARAIRSSRFKARAPRKSCRQLTPVPLDPIRYYHFTFGKVSGVDCLIARTGYTGEDGFEIYFAPEYSEKLWNDLMQAGETAGMIPCGLGARNTLRLEAGMCLYGHEIDDTTTPWEAGLGWICKMEKAPFLGSDALARSKNKPACTRKLVGFEMLDKRIGARWLSGHDRRARSRTRHQRLARRRF